MRGAAVILALLAVAAPAGAQEAKPARAQAFTRLPFWSGYWVSEAQAGTPIGGVLPQGVLARNPAEGVGTWNNHAPWNDEGRRRLAAAMATMGGRKGLGWGFPMMMNASTPLQVLITPEEVLIVNGYNEVRHIYTDGRAMPSAEDMWPTVTGTSVGHWDGDTLAIDTVMVTNPNQFFQGAPPLSEQAHYHERMRLDGKRLRSTLTIEDPVTLAAPWTVNLSWVRELGFDRMVQVDWNNDRTGSQDGTNTIEPPKDEQGK